MYVKDGLTFRRTEGGGLHISIQDGTAENSPVLREVIFTELDHTLLIAEIAPAPKKRRAATLKSKSKAKK